MENEKQLPPGRWIFIPRLSPETTKEALAEFIKACGYEIPVERCSVRYFPAGSSHAAFITGLISVPYADIPHLLAYLLTWLTTGQQLDGQPVQFEVLRDKHERAA